MTDDRLRAEARAGEPATTPRFSIVIPLFNSRRALLDEQLTAVLGQTEQSWECVLVDDGSTTSDVELAMAEWVGRDRRFRGHQRIKNGGIAAATNTAVDMARGEWVVFCDHDDRIAVHALGALAAAIDANPDVDVLYSDEELIDEHGVPIAVYRKPDYSPRRLLGHNYFNHLTCVRRSFLGDDRLRTGFEPSQDFDLVLRLTERARQVVHVPQVLYSWRAIGGSVALRPEEKPGVAESVVAGVRDAVARRGVAIEASAVADAGGNVASRCSPVLTEVAVLTAHDRTVDELTQAVIEAQTDVVAIADGDLADLDWVKLTAGEIVDGVVVAAPFVVDGENRLHSSGRVHFPTLREPFPGLAHDNSGPWGTALVVREVASVAPLAVVLHRQRFVDEGGFRHGETDLDVAMAEYCVRVREAGGRVVITPHVRVGLPSKRAAQVPWSVSTRYHELACQRPELVDDPYAAQGAMVNWRPTSIDLPWEPGSRYSRIADDVSSRRFRLLTVDVFDTLVYRTVAAPTDVFGRLARLLRERGLLSDDVDDQFFADARQRAERRARAARRNWQRLPEVTIEEIWAHMPENWRADEHVSWAAYIAAEFDAESAALRCHEPMVAMLIHAAQCGVPVAAVSDTYYSGAQLERLLASVGVPTTLLSYIITSSDWRRAKWDGLLDEVATYVGVSPSDVLHVGDNDRADGEAAERVGATSHMVHAPAVTHMWHENSGGHRSTDGDAGARALARETLLRSTIGFDDSAYQFAVAAVAPVMAGFASWVNRRSASMGASVVHCLLREGRLLADYIGLLAPHGVATRTLHASRWAVLRAAVIDGSPREITNALGRRGSFAASTVADAFGCDQRQVERVVRAAVGPAPDRWEALNALAEHDELREQIVAASSTIRKGVIAYLEQAVSSAALDGSEPLVLVDVGWGGTIQEGLTAIARSANLPCDVRGLYLMVNRAGDERRSLGHHLESYLPTGDDSAASGWFEVIARNPEILEQINTPAEGTLLSFTDDGRPVCAPPPQRHASLESAQRGVRDFVARVAAVGAGDHEDWMHPRLRASLASSLAMAIQHPGRDVARQIGGWTHDDVRGDHLEPLADETAARRLRYMSAVDAAKLEMDEVYWVHGAAAVAAPELLGPLDALRRGTPADALAVPSPAGQARLCAYAIGEQHAAALVETTPHLSPIGWCMLRIDGAVDSLRSIRLDVGAVSCLAQLELFDIVVELDDGSLTDVSLTSLDDRRLVWVDGRSIGRHQAAFAPGGHLLVDVNALLGRRVRAVRAMAAFRVWPLAADDADVTLPPLRSRASRLTAKLARRVPNPIDRARRAGGSRGHW